MYVVGVIVGTPAIIMVPCFVCLGEVYVCVFVCECECACMCV